ncbi:MAG: YbjN domain-containing protein [Cyanobacteria bacterium P01_E01_bin.42]
MTFQLSPELYQYIVTSNLFNLKSEIHFAFNSDSSSKIEIETILNPKLLPELASQTKDVAQIASCLLNLNEKQSNHSLFSAKNWFALRIKQDNLEYRTFWDYIYPSVLDRDKFASEKISQEILKYFKNWADFNLPALVEKQAYETLIEIRNNLEKQSNTKSIFLNQETVSELLDIMRDTFQEWGNTLNTKLSQDQSKKHSIFEIVVNFFKEDDWPFQEIEGEQALYSSFQGEHGKWDCYAKVLTEQMQFVFYSVYPINVPESKCFAIAEFLTRANYGMIIGNFELDFNDGEIRYKTSMNVEDNNLSSTSIKKLVYANVTMMEEYLPGIMSVIYGEKTPREAIAQIEG